MIVAAGELGRSAAEDAAMRTAFLCCLAIAALPGCSGDGKSNLERRYDGVQTGMTEEQVIGVMGPGRSVTAAEVNTYAEHLKFDTKEFPSDAKWVQWDGELQ